MMRVLEMADYGRMVVAERPVPEPGEREVLVRTAATGICGSDIHGYPGENGRRRPGQVMGHETAGTVAALGPGAASSGLTVGQPVTFNPVVLGDDAAAAYAGREQQSPHRIVIGVTPDVVAAFAQFVVVPARNVVALPAKLPIVYGALVEPLAVALHTLRRAGLRRGQRMVVVGGGPIGQSVVLAARMEGVTDVIVSEIEPGRRDLCAALGAVPADPRATPLAEQVSRVFGGPADLAIDAVGVSASLADAVSCTAVGATIGLVGMGSPDLELEAFRFSTEERSLVGSFCYSAADFAEAAAWVGTGASELSALVSREVGLEEAPEAFRRLAENDGTPGKVIVRMDGQE